jgi:CRISPR associated protein Cas1
LYENRVLAFGSQAKDDNEHNLTLSALKWLTETGASLVMLDRLGKVRVVTGPTSPSEARLRRAKAMAIANGTAAGIGRELISAKLAGHQTLVRREIETLGYSVKSACYQQLRWHASNFLPSKWLG